MREFDSFSECLDEFFGSFESQKADRKAILLEREAMKKLENVKKDHEVWFLCLKSVKKIDWERFFCDSILFLCCVLNGSFQRIWAAFKLFQERIRSLTQSRTEKEELANLLELNCEAVDRALLVIRSAIANQVLFQLLTDLVLQQYW